MTGRFTLRESAVSHLLSHPHWPSLEVIRHSPKQRNVATKRTDRLQILDVFYEQISKCTEGVLGAFLLNLSADHLGSGHSNASWHKVKTAFQGTGHNMLCSIPSSNMIDEIKNNKEKKAYQTCWTSLNTRKSKQQFKISKLDKESDCLLMQKMKSMLKVALPFLKISVIFC